MYCQIRFCIFKNYQLSEFYVVYGLKILKIVGAGFTEQRRKVKKNAFCTWEMGMAVINNYIDSSSHYLGIHFSGCQLAGVFCLHFC